MLGARGCGVGVRAFGFGSGEGGDDVSSDVQYGVHSVKHLDAQCWELGHSVGFEGAVSKGLPGWGESALKCTVLWNVKT